MSPLHLAYFAKVGVLLYLNGSPDPVTVIDAFHKEIYVRASRTGRRRVFAIMREGDCNACPWTFYDGSRQKQTVTSFEVGQP